MTEEWMKQQKQKVSKMGLFELKYYKGTVINSLAENPTKFFLYDLIDARLMALDLESSIAVSDESDLSEVAGGGAYD